MEDQRTAALFGLLLLFLSALFSLFSHASAASSKNGVPKIQHLNLLNDAVHREASPRKAELWSPLPLQGWKKYNYCMESSLPKESNGYLQVFLHGGLNQQRMGICDAVAVAKILNATLVIPYFEINHFWKDSSSFKDIFDVDHFISVLKDDIKIVKELPKKYSWSTREYCAKGVRRTRIKNAPSRASANWYIQKVMPILRRYGIASISPFTHRLSYDDLPMEAQVLRCKANFHALSFVPQVREFGDALIHRLRYPPDESDYIRMNTDVDRNKPEKFIVLHLRFDKDMAAHSACDFGGGKAEQRDLAKYRKKLWHGKMYNSQFTDQELRSQGRCPLTPEEIGLLLAALGFDSNTRLYLASHKVYGGKARMSSLKKLFPLMEDKKSLSSSEERTQMTGKASLLAAVDYYVAMHSDIFVSASLGNMHNAVFGHRTYKNLKTIRPNMVLLGELLSNKTISWMDFKQSIIDGHEDRKGEIILRTPTKSIYTYPAPDCMCQS